MRRLLLALGFMAVLLAACSGSSGLPSADSNSEQPGLQRTPAVQAPVEVRVIAKDNHFSPSSLQIKEGVPIQFIIKNEDLEDHEFGLTAADAPPC